MSEVKKTIASVDESLKDLIKFIKEKHEEFEKMFNVLKEVKTKNVENKIDPMKVAMVSATYPSMASWYLTEYQIASARDVALQEQYDVWLAARSPYAEKQMKENGEHVTQKTIKMKVHFLYSDEAAEWSKTVNESKTNKELLEKRLAIIHDTRYTLNATALLRSVWDQKGSGYVDENVLNEADKKMQNKQ